jgi:hypothetical protein
MSIPLLTFFTPMAPIRLFPAQNSVSHIPERDASRVSPLRNGQISGQLFRLTPRPAVAFPATTGLGSRPNPRPALGLLADSQVRRFAPCVWEIQSKHLTYLANYFDHTRRIPEFHFHPLTLRICESANLPISKPRPLACVLPGIGL